MTVVRPSVSRLTARSSLPASLRDRVRAAGPADVRAVCGAVAAVAVCLDLLATVAVNAPLGSGLPGGWSGVAVAAAAATVVPAVAAVAVGSVADSAWLLVGLVAGGLFALLASVTPAATVPAAGVVSLLALLLPVSTLADGGRDATRETLFAALVAVAVVVSLAGATGLLAPGARNAGTALAFAALVPAPLVVGATHRSLVVGLLCAVATGVAAVAAPFVSGAVLLAAGAAVDPPVVLLAAGVGGVAAVVVAGFERRRTTVVAGGLLLLAAGVPATVSRALAVALGAVLLLQAATGTSDDSTGGVPA